MLKLDLEKAEEPEVKLPTSTGSWKKEENSRKTSLVAQTVKRLPVMRETWVRSLGWEDPLEKEMQPTPVLLPGKSYGRRSLVGYNPWVRKESDTTE